jgi:purine-binding chemotaxis protein CheW
MNTAEVNLPPPPLAQAPAVESAGSVASASQENQLVTFYLGDEEFGFDIMSVQEIIRQPALSRVPMAPDYVDGIANLRGTVLPIIDTRSRFGMKREADTDSTRVLVVDVDGVKTGLRVDRVRQVTRIRASDVEAPPAVLRKGMSSDYLQGVVKLDAGKRIIMSLSPRALSRVEVQTDGGAQLQSESGEPGRGASTREAGEVAQSVTQVVSFKLGDEEFAFPMDRVREILRVARPSEVPDTPDYFLGILTVRGVILPVIDLRMLLGLRTLAADVEARIAQAQSSYERWLTAFTSHVEDRREPDPGAAGPELLRALVTGFNTSSETLMESLRCVRVANDKALRGCARRGELTNGSDARSLVDAEIAPFAREATGHLTTMQEQVAGNIQEDQRLIVVQADGASMALLVDKVREVLSVPTALIDAPPRLGKASERSEIKGVARLDDGKRLIMLLDADHLVEVQTLDAATQAAGGSMNGHSGPSEGSARGGAAGERQFVTFRLDDGEYGIPIGEIQEIDRFSKMTRIPGAAAHVDGVTNLRGAVIPVVNARRRFNLSVKEADERTRVLIIDVDGKKTGLLVDSVRQVLNLSLADIAPPPAALTSGIDQKYISGIGKVDGGKRMIVLLDVSRVVASEA